MGIMDKLKTAAQDVAAQGREKLDQGKEKIEEMQLRRKMDECAKELGYLHYNEEVKGVTQGADAERLVAEMRQLEASLQAVPPQTTYPDPDTPGAPAPPTSATEPPTTTT